MSSQYAGEQLTKEIINTVLGILEEASVRSFSFLERELQYRLNKHQWKRLQDKGGNKELSRVVSYMKRRGLAKESIDAVGAKTLSITSSGLERLESLQFSHIVSEADSWDGKWRIVMFDIPEEKRPARDAIRRLLKQLGFKQIQRSVWIHPLPCFEQFEKIRSAYGIDSHLQLAEATFAGNFHKRFCAMFREKYPDLF